MSWVVYGTDTGSIEDARQCVLVRIPDLECDSPESVESYLEDFGHLGVSMSKFIDIVEELNVYR